MGKNTGRLASRSRVRLSMPRSGDVLTIALSWQFVPGLALLGITGLAREEGLEGYTQVFWTQRLFSELLSPSPGSASSSVSDALGLVVRSRGNATDPFWAFCLSSRDP